MNKFELAFALPFLPLFCLITAIERRKNPIKELGRFWRNWKLHWDAS